MKRMESGSVLFDTFDSRYLESSPVWGYFVTGNALACVPTRGCVQSPKRSASTRYLYWYLRLPASTGGRTSPQIVFSYRLAHWLDADP